MRWGSGKSKRIDTARSFELKNVPKARLPSPPFQSILYGGRKGKKRVTLGE